MPDSDRNRSWLGKFKSRLGLAGYPALRIVVLAETGTRGLLGAVIGARGDRNEAPLARRLVPLLSKGMLVLADRAYDSGGLLSAIAATGAMFLCRGTSTRKPPVLQLLADGSYLSDLDGLTVRILEADLVVTGTDGTKIGDRYRLITTLTDHRRYPAAELIQLYHERWEIEVAYLALRHTLLGGYVLRSHDRPGAEQELWALLTVYQLLRMAITDTIESRPGTDPDRACFTSALQAARDQVIAACGITYDGAAGTGRIRSAVLNSMLPPRRRRYSACKVKCATSRYLNRDDGRPFQATATTHAAITVIAPPPDRPANRAHRARTRPPVTPGAPRPNTRRDQITQIIATQPPRDWAGHELALILNVRPRNMLTQPGEWTRLGFFTRTGFATYRLNTPPGSTSSTTRPDP